MKYITKRDSETGKKFAAVADKIKVAHNAIVALSNELGFDQWKGLWWTAFGGISSVIFPKNKTIDEKAWENVDESENEWMPRLSSEEGKEIQKRIDDLPKVRSYELNSCIGFYENFNCIGFSMTNEEYFGFEVAEIWNIKVPSDCEEVTTAHYNSLFLKEQD